MRVLTTTLMLSMLCTTAYAQKSLQNAPELDPEQFQPGIEIPRSQVPATRGPNANQQRQAMPRPTPMPRVVQVPSQQSPTLISPSASVRNPSIPHPAGADRSIQPPPGSIYYHNNEGARVVTNVILNMILPLIVGRR